MSRGDRRDDIYLDDVDRHDFLKTLAEDCEKTGCQVHRERHSGELRRETSQAKAERIVGEELRRLGWHEGDLTRRPKGDPEKMALAARLRQETTLTIQQIAQRVHLGTSRSANARLHAWMHPKAGAGPRKTDKGAPK